MEAAASRPPPQRWAAALRPPTFVEFIVGDGEAVAVAVAVAVAAAYTPYTPYTHYTHYTHYTNYGPLWTCLGSCACVVEL